MPPSSYAKELQDFKLTSHRVCRDRIYVVWLTCPNFSGILKLVFRLIHHQVHKDLAMGL